MSSDKTKQDLFFDLRFTDSKDFRYQLLSEATRILGFLLSRLDSTYQATIPSTMYSSFLRSLSEEFSKFRVASDTVKSNLYFTETQPEFLSQIVSYLLFKGLDNALVSSSFSDITFRQFLLNLIKAYFGGSTASNLENAAGLFTNADINIVELFLEARKTGSKYNVSDTFGYILDVSFDSIQLLSGLFSQELSGIPVVETNINSIIDNIIFLISSLEPAHVLVDKRFQLGDYPQTSVFDCPDCITFCPCEPELLETTGDPYYSACSVYIGGFSDSLLSTLEFTKGPALGSGTTLIQGVVLDINSRALTVSGITEPIQIITETEIYVTTSDSLISLPISGLLTEDTIGKAITISARYNPGRISFFYTPTQVITDMATQLGVSEDDVIVEPQFLRLPVVQDYAKLTREDGLLSQTRVTQLVKALAVPRDTTNLVLELSVSQSNSASISAGFINSVSSSEILSIVSITNVTKDSTYDLTNVGIESLTIDIDETITENQAIGLDDDDVIQVVYETYLNPTTICDSSKFNFFFYMYDDFRQVCCDTFCFNGEDLTVQAWPRIESTFEPQNEVLFDDGLPTEDYYNTYGTSKSYHTRFNPIVVPNSRDKLAFSTEDVTVYVASGVTNEELEIVSSVDFIFRTLYAGKTLISIYNSTKGKYYDIDSSIVDENFIRLNAGSPKNVEIGLDLSDTILGTYRLDYEEVDIAEVDPLFGVVTLANEPSENSLVKIDYCYINHPTYAMVLGNPHFTLGGDRSITSNYTTVLVNPDIPGQIVYQYLNDFHPFREITKKKRLVGTELSQSRIPLRTVSIPGSELFTTLYYTHIDKYYYASSVDGTEYTFHIENPITTDFTISDIVNVTKGDKYSLSNLQISKDVDLTLTIDKNTANLTIGLDSTDTILVHVTYYGIRQIVKNASLKTTKVERDLSPLTGLDLYHSSPVYSVDAVSTNTGYWFVTAKASRGIDCLFFTGTSFQSTTSILFKSTTITNPIVVKIEHLTKDQIGVIYTEDFDGKLDLYYAVVDPTYGIVLGPDPIASSLQSSEERSIFSSACIPDNTWVVAYQSGGTLYATTFNAVSRVQTPPMLIPIPSRVKNPQVACNSQGWAITVYGEDSPYTQKLIFIGYDGVINNIVDYPNPTYDSCLLPLEEIVVNDPIIQPRVTCPVFTRTNFYGFALVAMQHDAFYGENFIYATHYDNSGDVFKNTFKISGPTRYFQNGPYYFTGRSEFAISIPQKGYLVGYISIDEDNQFLIRAVAKDGTFLQDLSIPIIDVQANTPPEEYVAFTQLLYYNSNVIATWQTSTYISRSEGLDDLRFLLNNPPEDVLNLLIPYHYEEIDRFTAEDIYQSSYEVTIPDTLQNRFTPAILSRSYHAWQTQHSSVLHSDYFKKNVFSKPNQRGSFTGRNLFNDYKRMYSLTPTPTFEGTPLIPRTLTDAYGLSKKEYIDPLDINPLVEDALFSKLYSNLKESVVVGDGDLVDWTEPGLRRIVENNRIESNLSKTEVVGMEALGTWGLVLGGLLNPNLWPKLNNLDVSHVTEKLLPDTIHRSNPFAQFTTVCDTRFVEINFRGFEDSYYFQDCDTIILNVPNSVTNRPCIPKAEKQPWILLSGPDPIEGLTTQSFTRESNCAIKATLIINDVAESYCLLGGRFTTGIPSSISEDAPTAIISTTNETDVGATVVLSGDESTDPNDLTLTYRWTLLAKPLLSSATLSSTDNIEVNLTPDKAGEYIVSLVVSNGTLDSQPKTTTILVVANEFNTIPVAIITVSTPTVVEGTSIVLDGAASFDLDGDTLAYSWFVSSNPGSIAYTLENASTSQATFTPLGVGEFEISLVVNDGTVDSPVTITSITSVSVNDPPVAIIATVTQGITNNPITLDGSQSFDPEGAQITHLWSIYAKPTGSSSSITDSTSSTTTFIPDVAGTYIVRLVVSDPDGPGTPVNSTITIVPSNIKPIANAGSDANSTEGSTVTLNGLRSVDPDNTAPLAYKWTIVTKPVGSSAQLSSTVSPLPSMICDKPGSYLVKLVVNDSIVDSDPDFVTIVCNGKPIPNAGNDRTVLVGTSTTLDGSQSFDPENDSLSYQWTVVTKPVGSSVTITNSTNSIGSFTPDLPGTYIIRLAVSDSINSAQVDDVQITAIVSNEWSINSGWDWTS